VIIRGEIVEPKTHAELVEIGYKWLLRNKSIKSNLDFYMPCQLALKEISTYNTELPDVIGFRMDYSILIECKASRNDFLADAKKDFRINPINGMGAVRFFLANKGIIKVEELPNGWGLLEVEKNNVIILKHAEYLEKYNIQAEKMLLLTLLKRIAHFNLMDVINDTRLKKDDYFYDSCKIEQGGER
jgi:hypothetical protein